MPELFGDQYHYFVGKVRYIQNPLKEAFNICRASFKEVDSVIIFERVLDKSFPADKKYTMERRGKSKKETQEYAVEYSLAYQKMMHGMLERRMRASILPVGSYWYSAWVDAGQPDLNKLIEEPLIADQQQKIQQEETLYRTGKIVHLAK